MASALLIQFIYIIILIPMIFDQAINDWKIEEVDNQEMVDWLIMALTLYFLYLGFNIFIILVKLYGRCNYDVRARHFFMRAYSYFLVLSSAAIGLLGIHGLSICHRMKRPKSEEFLQAVVFVIFWLSINGIILWFVVYYLIV